MSLAEGASRDKSDLHAKDKKAFPEPHRTEEARVCGEDVVPMLLPFPITKGVARRSM